MIHRFHRDIRNTINRDSSNVVNEIVLFVQSVDKNFRVGIFPLVLDKGLSILSADQSNILANFLGMLTLALYFISKGAVFCTISCDVDKGCVKFDLQGGFLDYFKLVHYGVFGLMFWADATQESNVCNVPFLGYVALPE